MHRFQVIADDSSNLRCRSHAFWIKRINTGSETLASRKYKYRCIVWWKAYFHILNRLSVTREYDRQTDGRTDIVVANATLYHVARPKKDQQLMAVASSITGWFPKFFDRCKTVLARLPFNRRPSTREQDITEALFNPPLSATLGPPL